MLVIFLISILNYLQSQFVIAEGSNLFACVFGISALFIKLIFSMFNLTQVYVIKLRLHYIPLLSI